MSLCVSYGNDNIFAKIIRGDMPCVKIYETDNVLAFMDVFPQSEGHCLVVHKTQKAVNLLDISPDALGELIAGVQKITGAVKDALNPDGLRIVQFNGAPAGQTVFHLHFHIIPTYEGVALGAHADTSPRDAAQLELIAAKIRTTL